MSQKRNILAGAAIVLACGLPAGLFGADPVPANITTAINSFGRDITEKVRDPQMKPADVLTFLEVKTGGVAVEFVPGDGYWTKLFSKAVGNQGHVYPLYPARGGRTLSQQRAAERAAAAAGKPMPPDPFDIPLSLMFMGEFKNVKAIAESIESWHGNFGIPENADVIYNADSYHSFHNAIAGGDPNFSKPYNMTEINRAIWRAMKPGAVYVISDYAAAPGAGFSATETLKRSEPEAVKAELTGVGFEFAGSLDVYANPADDHTKPSGSTNNPDRFMLKFRKPRNVQMVDKRPKGEALAAWNKNWLENTLASGSGPPQFTNGLYYHTDGSCEEEGGNPNSVVLLCSFFWDVEGHNCQYHERAGAQGVTVCHAYDSLEAMSGVPGGRPWASLAGFVDNPETVKGLVKGQVRAFPTAGRTVGEEQPAGGTAAPAGPGRAGVPTPGGAAR